MSPDIDPAQQSPALLERGARSLVIWEENTDLRGAQLRDDGSMADTFTLIRQPGTESGPALSPDGNGIMVYSGWADLIQGKPGRTQRIWSAALPVSAIKDVWGCDPESKRFGTYPQTQSAVSCRPNPARDWLQLDRAGESGRHGGLTLRDVSGREVCRLRDGINDVRALAPGVYFLRAGSMSEDTIPNRSDSGHVSRPLKLVIQR